MANVVHYHLYYTKPHPDRRTRFEAISIIKQMVDCQTCMGYIRRASEKKKK